MAAESVAPPPSTLATRVIRIRLLKELFLLLGRQNLETLDERQTSSIRDRNCRGENR